MKLVFVRHKYGYQDVQAFGEISADRLQLEVNRVLTGEFMQRVEEDSDVPDVTHGTLIVMHALEIIVWRLGQQGADDFRHISKLLKSNARLMDGTRLCSVDLSVQIGCPEIGLIDG